MICPLIVDTEYVRTYYVFMNLTLAIEDELLEKARQRADALGTSVNQMVRDYLEEFVGGGVNRESETEEFIRLSLKGGGDSKGWKWNRDEIQRYP